MATNKQRFYIIYQITNLLTGKIYVGAHSTFNIHDRYMGSSKYLKKDIKEFGRKNFKKEILHVFMSEEEMINKEGEIVNKKFCLRTDTYNLALGGIVDNFTWIGTVTVKDKDGNTSRVFCEDPRYLSGELVPIGKGKIVVRDKDGKKFQVDIDDPRYLSGEFEFFHKGKKGKSGMEGKRHSDATLNKMSKVKKGNKNGLGCKHSLESINKRKKKREKEFYVYNLDGEFISKEKGISEFARANGLSHGNIVTVLQGKAKQTKGYKFFYEYQGEKLN